MASPISTTLLLLRYEFSYVAETNPVGWIHDAETASGQLQLLPPQSVIVPERHTAESTLLVLCGPVRSCFY